MKNQASTIMKQVISTLLSFVKAKSMAVKNKTSAMKTRLMILGILRNKKILMSSITQKIHALTSHGKERNVVGDNDDSKAIVLYNTKATEGQLSSDQMYSTIVENYDDDDDDDNKYPDLRHCLFDEDDELGDCNGSVIDLVRNNREEGMEFKLEDEIDQVADLFIRRFHKKMWLQKQQSFKMYQEMLARGT